MIVDLDTNRRDVTYVQLGKLIDQLGKLPVSLPLVWLWVWDVTLHTIDSYDGDDYTRNPDYTEKDVFDMFWEDAEKNGFTLEYGVEHLDEAIFDWLLERNILVALDDDGWLNDV